LKGIIAMISKLRQGNKVAQNLAEYVVDDIADLSKLPKAFMGSTVYVIHTQETYMIDSKGIWYPMDSDSPPVECDCVEESTIWEELPE
jgi:hypothetical protein